MSHLPGILAFAPAAFVGLAAAILTRSSLLLARRPVPLGEAEAYRLKQSMLLVGITVSLLVFMVCLAVAFAYLDGLHALGGWRGD